MSFPIGNGIPEVHSISGYGLERMGFKKESEYILPNSQTKETTYRKGEQVVFYNGCKWVYNNNIVEFLEDIK
jgi:hypothetical protein